MEPGRRFIESPEFPIKLINMRSVKEKGPGRPPHWEMVFWWTRKPLIGARAIIAASLLPYDINKYDFIKWMRLDSEKSPHRYNPQIPEKYKELFRRSSLLDPFAGFGSIPLEALRLGIGEVYAVEFLPSAYIFLKAVLEYPKKYGKALIEDVKKWGNWIIEKLKEDPEISELYNDAAVYIGTWEVKCPVCGKYTPLVGNWWLSRVKGGQYAYMKPKVINDRVEIEIVEGEKRGAPEPNIRGRPQHAKCLLCGTNITTHNGEFYPKVALKDWNRKLEEYLNGRISLDDLKNSLARPRILIKVYVRTRELKFIPANQSDQEKLWVAIKKLEQIWGDPDIPTEPIPDYEKRQLMVCTSTGACKWFKLFNPRQLLTLVKLVKQIREVGRKVKEEKLKEGWSKENAFKYAEAVTTYLAMSLIEHVRYNSIVSSWNPTSWAESKIRDALSFRGIAMVWNFIEVPTHTSEDIMYSYAWSVKTEIDGLSYLISAISGSPNKVRVLLDNATVLRKLKDERFDVIITDPPYRDDIPYVELSDFYYVWLKKVFSDKDANPLYHQDAIKFNTQWESLAIEEISHNEGRFNFFGINERDYYTKMLGQSFRKFNEILDNNGILITYFAHSSPKAWIDLIKASWEIGNFRVIRAWSLMTESAQRVTARGKTALESSIIVVWRKKEKLQVEYVDIYNKALENAEKEFQEAVKNKLSKADIFLATMIGALSQFTKYDKIIDYNKEINTERIVKEAYSIAVKVLSRSREKLMSPESLFYLTVKSLFRAYSKEGGQATLETESIVLSSQDVIMLSYGVLGSESDWKYFKDKGIIIESGKIGGSRVAQQKTFTLLEPISDDIKTLNELLGMKRVSPLRLEAHGRELTPIDVLHILEYYALQGLSRFREAYRALSERHPETLSEALALARTIREFNMDPEKGLCERVLDYVEVL